MTLERGGDPVRPAGAGPIVFVDDSESDRHIAAECHRRSSARRALLLLESGRALLELLDLAAAGRAEPPAAVLLDVNMPDLDGHATLDAVRGRTDGADLPILLFLTDLADRRQVDAARAHGANGWAVKPMRTAGWVELFESLQS